MKNPEEPKHFGLIQKYLPVIYEVYPALNGTLDNDVIFMFHGNLSNQIFVALAVPVSCLLNFCVAFLIFLKLRWIRAAMSKTTYQLHLRLTFALILQVSYRSCTQLSFHLPLVSLKTYRYHKTPINSPHLLTLRTMFKN
jgi:hypothetical protein